jgi:hypothetical protein
VSQAARAEDSSRGFRTSTAKASASLEYYVKQGDSNAVTHYFTISPTQIKIDS